jgi:ATP-binding cassette subfamily B (MDR/TAP) protein 1
LVFGELIDVFGLWTIQPYPGAYITSEQLLSQVSDKTLYFLILAAVTFVATYIYMVIAVYTSEANSFRIRRQYLLAVLRQNIGWFDNVGAGEVATTISTDTLLIQDGIGEKLPLAVAAISTFIAGISIAFYRNWKMTLVLCSVLPFIAISGGITNVVGGRFQTRILALYSKSGNIAEETISSARTVVSFNAQKKLSALYDASLFLARKEGIKKSIVTGIGLGALFLFLYCAYSLAFWYGHILLLENAITPGTVVNVFFAVLIGAFALGSIAPDIQAFSFAVGAGTKIFETIDRVPDIDPYNEDGIKIPPENFNGLIELTDVEFSYPSRPTIHVLKKISLKIEPGHTIALIGQSGSGKRYL